MSFAFYTHTCCTYLYMFAYNNNIFIYHTDRQTDRQTQHISQTMCAVLAHLLLCRIYRFLMNVYISDKSCHFHTCTHVLASIVWSMLISVCECGTMCNAHTYMNMQRKSAERRLSNSHTIIINIRHHII